MLENSLKAEKSARTRSERGWPPRSDAVLVHDAARPFCPGAVIDRLVASLEFYEGAAPVLPVGDTLARVGETLGDGIDRGGLVRIQTPQAFRLADLKCLRALVRARADG